MLVSWRVQHHELYTDILGVFEYILDIFQVRVGKPALLRVAFSG
jgi:hypothetical protein